MPMHTKTRQRRERTGQRLMDAWWDAGCQEAVACRNILEDDPEGRTKFQVEGDMESILIDFDFTPTRLRADLDQVLRADRAGDIRLPLHQKNFLLAVARADFNLARLPDFHETDDGRSVLRYRVLKSIRQTWDRHLKR